MVDVHDGELSTYSFNSCSVNSASLSVVVFIPLVDAASWTVGQIEFITRETQTFLNLTLRQLYVDKAKPTAMLHIIYAFYNFVK